MTALTFEQTYVKYPFATLVAMAVNLSAYFCENHTHKTTDTDVDMNLNMPHAA